MKETDDIRMEIKIAGDRLYLTVPFLKQMEVREAERRVVGLFQSFTSRYPGMGPKQVLAMVAYELASLYNRLLKETDSAVQAAEEVETRLREMVRKGQQKSAFTVDPSNHPDILPPSDNDTDSEENDSGNEYYTSY